MGSWWRTLSALMLVGVASSGALRSASACAPDEALESVAVDVLLGDVNASPRALMAAVARRGSSAVEAHLVDVDTAAQARRVLRRLEERIGLPLRCGRAEAEGRGVVVVAAPDVASLSRVKGGARGTLRDGYGNAHLVYRDARGRAHRIPVDSSALALGVDLPGDVDWRTVELQLVADTPSGPRPLARLPGPLPAADPASITGEPLEVVRGARERIGASSLRVNALLAREATEHARLVCASARASHLGTFGDPEERLRSRGIAARVVGEAVARARSVEEALEAMLASPSHRAALEDDRFTDLGLGVATRGETRCVVALLAAFPRAVPPARPPNEVDRTPIRRAAGRPD